MPAPSITVQTSFRAWISERGSEMLAMGYSFAAVAERFADEVACAGANIQDFCERARLYDIAAEFEANMEVVGGNNVPFGCFA